MNALELDMNERGSYQYWEPILFVIELLQSHQGHHLISERANIYSVARSCARSNLTSSKPSSLLVLSCSYRQRNPMSTPGSSEMTFGNLDATSRVPRSLENTLWLSAGHIADLLIKHNWSLCWKKESNTGPSRRFAPRPPAAHGDRPHPAL